MHVVFWLLLLGFAGLIGVTVVIGRRLRGSYSSGNEAAVTAYRVEHGLAIADDEPPADEEDLDTKWDAYWHDQELAYRASPLFVWLHDDEKTQLREAKERLAAELDQTEAAFAVRSARAVDGGIRQFKWGYAGLVDMFAQKIYARRRSVRRMVAVLDKTTTWPVEWQRQLRVLLAENAVGRARKEVKAR